LARSLPLMLTCLHCPFHGLRLERVVRELVAAREYTRVQVVIEQLCNEFAYAVHQSHARNGGLIGLAAAAIALGPVSNSSFRKRRSSAVLFSLVERTCYVGNVCLHQMPARAYAMCLIGAPTVSCTNRAARAGLLHRSRCPCSLLRL